MRRRLLAFAMTLLILLNVFGVVVSARSVSVEEPTPNTVDGQSGVQDPDNTVQSGALASSSGTGQPSQESVDNSQSSNASDKKKLIESSVWNTSLFLDGSHGTFVVGIRREMANGYSELENVAARNRGTIINSVSLKSEVIAAVVRVPLETISTFLVETRDNGLSEYIEPNLKFQTQFTPNDPAWNVQWGPTKIRADWAWNTTTGSHSILVAVVDTGIYYPHEDLAANYVPIGYDWVNNDPDPTDDHGHGTHVAGTIAATLNNSKGIAGLAQVQVMAEKGLNMYGYGTEDVLAEAIIHAVDQGANIISMSWGGSGDSKLIHGAIKYAYDRGVMLVAAAGNSATSVKLYPAAYDEVIAVTATDRDDSPAWFSSFGDWVELAAPGVDIYSTVPGGYTLASGTSMATPHVSGLAALVWSKFPNKTRDWVRLWLEYTALDLGSPGFDVNYGYGRIDARKALEQAPPESDLIAYSWKTPFFVEPGSEASINATVLNFGERNQNNTLVQLLANGSLVDSKLINYLQGGESAHIQLRWAPVVQGRYNVTVYVVPSENETVIENNILCTNISVGFPIKVFVLNSYGTMYTDAWDALNAKWNQFGNKIVYIDYKTLDKENLSYEDLVASNADVLVISCAYNPDYGWQFTDSEIDAIKKYVFEGHGLIATAGTFYGAVPNNNKLAPLFGLNETIVWSASWSDLQHLKDPLHAIFRNIPNPFIFPAEGTALPSDGRWSTNELAGGTYLSKGHYEESAIVAYKGLVYISFWPEVLPEYYFFPLQLLYNTITWTNYQKPDHDLVAYLRTPSFLKPGESAIVNATVVNSGLNNETNIELSLLIDNITVKSATVSELQIGSPFTINYTWTPTVVRAFNLTAYVKPLSNEEFFKNNVYTKIVFVHFPLFVLWDDTKDSDGDQLLGNYFLLYQLLTERGYIVDELNTGPINAGVLTGYDVFVLMDPELEFSSDEISDIQKWVDAGGTLLTVPDSGYPASIDSLMMPYGVRMTGWAGGYGSTTDVAGHPVTEGVNSVFVNYAHEIQVTSPSVSLAWINDFGVRLAFLSAAKGFKVVVASDSNIMDNSGLGMADNEQLMLNIFSWLGIKPEHELSVSLDSPFFIEIGNSTILNATVRNLGLRNETSVELQLLINGTVVNSVLISELITRSRYTLHQPWAPFVSGIYNVTVYAPPLLLEQSVINNAASARVKVAAHSLGRVAVLDSAVTPWYFVGGPSNDYKVLVEGLSSQGFYTQGVTNDQITNGILNTFDLFVMVDNVPSDAAAPYIIGFWSAGGGIIAFDSSICFLNYIGILPPEAALGNGYETYWDYGTGRTGKVSKNHPVTVGYSIDQLVYGTAGDAQYKVDYLAMTEAFPYYSMLVQDLNKTNRAYVSAYEPPAAGRTVHIWDHKHWRNNGLQLMIVNAVEWVKRPIRDVAIISAFPSASSAMVGDTLSIDVIAQNQGNATETFTVTARAVPSNSTRIYLDPSDYLFDAATVGMGHKFNVTVKVHDVKDLASWQVRANFNDSIINATRWFEPTWDSSYVFYDRGTFPLPPPPKVLYYHWGPGSGSVQAGSMLVPMQTGTGFNGDGLVAIFEFQITAIPAPSETCSSVLMIQNPDTTLLDSNVEEIQTVKKNGYYSLGWGGPPPQPPGFYIIGTRTVYDLAPGANVTLVFLWNTSDVSPRYYRIIAEASEVPNEIDTTDNIYVDGTIRIMKVPKADFSYWPQFAKAGEAVTFDASISSPNGGVIVNYSWDFGDSNVTSTTGPVVTHAYSTNGYYNVTLTITDNEGLEASTSKAIYVFHRDVAVVEVTASTNQTYMGRTIDINITIKNKGEVTENFTLILYCSIVDEGMNREQNSISMILGSIIETKDITNMLPGESRTLVFHWNTIGVSSNRYLLTGLATPVFGETHTADNTKPSAGPVRVKIVGDVNGDDKVDIKDLAIAAKSYGSNIGYPTWSPDADLNEDGRIDIRDLVIIARSFGKQI